MRGSFKIFTWLGIPVFLHWTFGLIFVFILWESQKQGIGWLGIAIATGFYMSLFACVLLHEYGHALAARFYKVKTRDIVLLPIGGMARLERIPEKPVQEFVVAIAGPAVNLAIALLLLLGMRLVAGADLFEYMYYDMMADVKGFVGIDDERVIEDGEMWVSPIMEFAKALTLANIVLMLFNLIPAFPMDGGRVFRALLSMGLGRSRATRIASWVGQAVALGFIIYGLMNDSIMLSILGLFVIFAARTENNTVQTETLLSRFKARDVMRYQFTRLRSNDWMMTAIETLRHGLERHFLVFDVNDRLVGMLEEEEILRAMRKPDITTDINQYTQRAELILSEESLLKVHYLIRQRGNGIVGVTDESGTLLGVIDEAGLSHFVRLQEGA